MKFEEEFMEIIDMNMKNFDEYCSKMSKNDLLQLQNKLRDFSIDIMYALSPISSDKGMTKFLVNKRSRIDEAIDKNAYINNLLKI